MIRCTTLAPMLAACVTIAPILTAGLGACETEPPPRTATGHLERYYRPPTLTSAEIMEAQAADCPMAVTGASVETRETLAGMDMTFTTASGDSAELRRRAYEMAEHMSSRKGGSGAALAADIPPVRVEVAGLEDGALVRITALDPSRADEMRIRLRWRARMMAEKHGCPD